MRNKVKERHVTAGLPVDGPGTGGFVPENQVGKRSFEVLRAREMGMCFGVRDALAMAGGVTKAAELTVFGQLVHNPRVTANLRDRGFRLLEEAQRPQAGEIQTPGVLITAHGVSDAQRRAFADAGLKVVDTTCPLVRKAHSAALTLAGEGRHVLVVGKPGHVEVLGLTGDLASFDVVSAADEVRAYGFGRLGIVAQTTTPDDVFDEVVAQVRAWNPRADVRAIRTVCQPTRDRQLAAQELLDMVDGLVVVGGANSNNSRMLAEAAGLRGKGAILVSSAAELDADRVWGMLPEGKERLVVGLTAGTSTLDETVMEVEQVLRSLGVGE